MTDEVYDRAAWLAERARAKAAEREERRRAWHEAHEAEREERRRQRRIERDQRKASYALARADVHANPDARFEEEMAASLNITVAEFRALQEQRRAEIDDRPAISYSPDHRVH